MEVTVRSRSGRQLAVLQGLSGASTVQELQRALHRARPECTPERQRLSVARGEERPQVLRKGQLADYGLDGGPCEVIFRDLGPQIAWKLVFVLEYLGPLVIYPLLYLQPSLIYGAHSSSGPLPVQTIMCALYVFHFLKREFETLFVHRFGTSTMPLRNLFKNCGYYWLNSLLLAYFCNHPLYTPASLPVQYVGIALFIVGELGNLHAHFVLRGLRKPGSTERNIPRGGLFELVSCANYFYEILAWTAFALLSQTVVAWLFMLQGAGQQWVWAKQKHARYRKEFTDYPRGRKALVPFLT
mmetsp:Transcript_2573/g.9156  ORF Transcript_2573/g.9156 Transcript_2573/m.9156 type:complete len:298 (-) Transcript_2573:39-932(-)